MEIIEFVEKEKYSSKREKIEQRWQKTAYLIQGAVRPEKQVMYPVNRQSIRSVHISLHQDTLLT